MKVLVLLICLWGVMAVKPPTPSCQSFPASKILPVTHMETQRWDLEYLFYGYNLEFKIEGVNYTTMSEKYTRHEKAYEHNMNFTSARVQGNGRFLGIETQNDKTVLHIGMNSKDSGVTINKTVTVEELVGTKCFDVAEVYVHNTSYAMIDCATFRNGNVNINEFFYVDLITFQVKETTRINDVFVRYTDIKRRFIWFEHDAFNNVSHLYRVVRSEDVDREHSTQTYLEIFEVSDGINPILIDVIDHTIFEQKTLEIVDFKFYEGLIYILDYNRALYEIRFTRDQRIDIRSKFNVKNDVTRFTLNRLGVNDDLTVVFSNGHLVYQYNWIIPNTPILKFKYTLIPHSEVEHIFVNQNFVIVSAWSTIKGIVKDTVYRKLWVFSHLSSSYLDAFASFDLPQIGAFNMFFEPSTAHLVVLGNYRSMNLQFSLPFIIINPDKASLIGTQLDLNITAVSYESTDAQSNATCSQIVTFVVIKPDNMSIFGRGFQGKSKYVVDSPDEREFYIGELFFGPYIDYDLTFNTTIQPEYEIEKRIRSRVEWKGMTENATITFVDMFQFIDTHEPKNIYGLIEDSEENVHFIECKSNRAASTVKCETLFKTKLNYGPISVISRVDGEDIEHHMAITYKNKPNDVYVYKLTKGALHFVGNVNYIGVFDNVISSMSISRNLLFVVCEVGKRVDVYRLEDLGKVNPTPISRITSTMMKYFGVPYFAPMECETSIYHDEIVFLKTKTGVIALQVDEIGIAILMFTIPMSTSKYEMEISNDNILIFDETEAHLYQLQVPLMRNQHPYHLQSFTNQTFTLGKYSELIADQFFYIIHDYKITVIHTDMPSNSIFYDEIETNGVIQDIDAVKFQDREYLIVTDVSGLSCWELFPDPKVLIKWSDQQPDFEVQLNASNTKSSAVTDPIKFAVLNLSESKIIPTEKFHNAKLNEIIAFPDHKSNVINPIKNISFSDQGWFNGSILHYRAQCHDCGNDIHFHNKVYSEGDIIAAPYIYEVESSPTGTFMQQYESLLKTYLNNSIQFQVMIPTNMPGEPCTKLTLPQNELFAVSLCETGDYTNMYITTFASEKPFTFGPTKSPAKQINKAKFEHGLLMLVDVEDNIFDRAGGIYLYALHLNPTDDEQFALLDVIQTEDLQIGDFKGLAYISSADLKYTGEDNRYHLIVTEAFSGGMFVFTLYLNRARNEIIYESQIYFSVQKLFDDTLLIPDPIRISTAIIVRESMMNKQYTYGILVTVSNWHHIHFNITIEGDKIISKKVLRLYERFPLTLVNYLKIKEPPFGFFAVPYMNTTLSKQFVAVYDLKDHEDAVQEQGYIRASKDIPLTPLIGSHYVNDTNEVSFDFNETNRQNWTGESKYDNLLFVDVDSHNLTSLKINRNLTVLFQNEPANQTLTLTAMNIFTNLTFTMDITFAPEKPPVPPEPDVEVVEIIWIIILIVGFIIIVGLVLICAYQIKKERLERARGEENKQSLISRDSTPLNLNRTTFNSELPGEDVPRDSYVPPVVSRTSEIEIQTDEQEDI